MRKILFIIFLFTLSRVGAQVVFCPPGAEWHYSYVVNPIWTGVYHFQNETIRYVKDSIVGNDTAKVLFHKKFYLSCNGSNMLTTTLIKQKGDTVFFRNARTQNTWQILYNFATPVSQGWQTTILAPYSNSSTITYGFTVDSISYITINNHALKRMYFGGNSVTERFGWNSFLFRFQNAGCDGDYFSGFLCYQDSTFGLKQFGDTPCDFQGTLTVGMNKFSEDGRGLLLSPNPAIDILYLKWQNKVPDNYTIEITNSMGSVLISHPVMELQSILSIDIKKLASGIYTLRVLQGNRLIQLKKIIKE